MGGYHGGDGKSLASLHGQQRGDNLLFYEDPPILPNQYPFFKLFPPPPPPAPPLTTHTHFPVISNLHPRCSFCCPVSLAEWVITLHLMCYFT